MCMRTVPLSSGLDWAVRLPAGYPLFFMAALLLSIGAAALITAGSVVMLPHESQALGLELAMLHGFHPRQPLVSFIVHNRVSFGGLLIMNGLLYWWLTRQITRIGAALGMVDPLPVRRCGRIELSCLLPPRVLGPDTRFGHYCHRRRVGDRTGPDLAAYGWSGAGVPAKGAGAATVHSCAATVDRVGRGYTPRRAGHIGRRHDTCVCANGPGISRLDDR